MGDHKVHVVASYKHMYHIVLLIVKISASSTSRYSPHDSVPTLFRYVRREKEIAQTKRELAESENTRNQQLVEHLQRQLTEAQDQLREVGEAARVHSETAAQHAEILSKVK